MKQSRAIQKSEYNFEFTGYDNCVSQAGVWVKFSALVAFMTMILKTDDPNFLSCCYFSIEQQVSYNFNSLFYCY